MEKADITASVVGALLAEQAPCWADLPVKPVDRDGWDNTTFRLGHDMSVRLPSAEWYVPQVDKEHRWLPTLAPLLPLPIPQPLFRGDPGPIFPRPWSVYRWLPGQPVTGGGAADLSSFAADLARFLRALYGIDASDGPAAGPHSFFRGGPVATYDEQTRATIEDLVERIDAAAALRVWEMALATTWSRPPVWVHGDVAPLNLLVVDGRLAGVIDFGCSAVGDPACDLTIAWTLFDERARSTFRRELRLDDDTWDRARGWALWKALIMLRQDVDDPAKAATSGLGMGWARTTHQVIEAVCREGRAA